MNKKELRKELELELVKSIEALISQKNAAVVKHLKKHVESAAKLVAKKYVKQLKEQAAPKKKPAPAPQKGTAKKVLAPAKKAPAKAVKRKK